MKSVRSSALAVASLFPLLLNAAVIPRHASQLLRRGVLTSISGISTLGLPFIAHSAVVLPPPKKAVRPYAYSIEFTNPPCLIPRTRIGEENSLKRFCQADALLIGEHPRSEIDKQLTVDLLSRMMKMNPTKKIVLGLEMIEQPFQFAIDEYLSSSLPAEEADIVLFNTTEWNNRWKFSFEPYRQIFHFAKANHIQILALGLSSETLLRVLDGGFDALTETDRSKYIPDANHFANFVRIPGYKRYADKVILPSYEFYASNNLLGDSPSEEKFFSSRILRHEAIAGHIAKYAKEHPDAVIISLLANENVKFGFGVTERTKTLLASMRGLPESEGTPVPPSKALVAPIGGGKDVLSLLLNPSAADSISQTVQLSLSLGYGTILGESRPLADYLWFSDYPELKLLTRPKNAINNEGEKPPGESSILGAF